MKHLKLFFKDLWKLRYLTIKIWIFFFIVTLFSGSELIYIDFLKSGSFALIITILGIIYIKILRYYKLIS